MEQKSDVQYRAEKEYKNSRAKFYLLLREIISNSIHAVLIRQNKEKGFQPELKLNITFDEEKKYCKIELFDNGEGFTKTNRQYFEELDTKNSEKEEMHFHPLGQGRLAIVYFADSAEYETVYKDETGNLKKRRIPYPDINPKNILFSFNSFLEKNPSETDSYTKLTIEINTPPSFSRAKTFFNKHPNIARFKQWFIETFFPFIVANENLEVILQFNGDIENIRKDNIEAETKTLPFELQLREKNDENDNIKQSFKLWLIKKNGENNGDNPVVCFARNLRADLSEGEITYSIDNGDGYLFYLTSDYFDEQVDTKGEKIEIDINTIDLIKKKIEEILDNEFKTIIENNRQITKRNLNKFSNSFPSLEKFIDEQKITNNKVIIKENDMVQSAIDEKGRIEKKFWTYDNNKNNFDESNECEKLINSSLHIYIKHRERILKNLHDLIQKFDDEGNNKSELESTVHELFLKRGTTLENNINTSHLHNLWILDDKFTIFSNNFKAKSTKPGQALSDIYIWADDPEKTKQILILELKSTTKAYNAGKNEDGMIAQVKGYAQGFYQNPQKHLNWDVDTDNVQYMSIIIARKSDINKELKSNTVSGYKRIPFLPNSFYSNDTFQKPNVIDPMDKIPIRIELYSFEDIYKLAYSRNEVFFKLLKNEFKVEEDKESD